MAGFNFSIRAESGGARTGVMQTRRGAVRTPAFMPVGTAGSVKGLMPGEVSGLGADIVLANTYHLMLRPGVEVVEAIGGLHSFMDWPGPILTDSGGFQVFSLAGLRKVKEQGVTFRSHLDGAEMELSPESCIEAQTRLGSDIMMMLDECPPAGAERGYLEKALERDVRWAARAREARDERSGALFGIVQGGVHADLRARSAELICSLDLEGYALGGLSVGEAKEETRAAVESTAGLLPPDQPRYLMGVGDPVGLVVSVGQGVDLFDCVLPTRMARNGTLLTKRGGLNIRNSRFGDDPRPVEGDCTCPACRRFSRAYMRHLFMARELLAYRLNTLHNLHFVLGLMAGLRQAIEEDKYEAFARGFLSAWREELPGGAHDN